MATLIQRTTSNSPELRDPDALEAVLEEFEFVPGPAGSISAEVRNGSLSICGEGPFAPVHRSNAPENDHDFLKYDDVKHERFLATVAEHIDEPLIVQETTNEKLRYPLGGACWVVPPGGPPSDTEHVSLVGFAHEVTQRWETEDPAPETVEVPVSALESIKGAVATIRQNRPDDPELVSYALDDLETTLQKLEDPEPTAEKAEVA